MGKISTQTQLSATPATGDLLTIVDISEPADADKNKRITVSDLMSFAGDITDTLASDASTTSTTYQDVGCEVTLPAGTYAVRIQIYTGYLLDSGLKTKLVFSGSATINMVEQGNTYDNASTLTSESNIAEATASGHEFIISGGGSAIINNTIITYEGRVSVAAERTLKIQYGAHTGGGSGTGIEIGTHITATAE